MEIARTAAALVEAVSSPHKVSIEPILLVCRRSHVAHKFGQLLAGRVDLFGRERCEQLRSGLSEQPPHSWTHASKQLLNLIEDVNLRGRSAVESTLTEEQIAELLQKLRQTASLPPDETRPWLPVVPEDSSLSILGVGAMAQVYGLEQGLAVKVLHPDLWSELQSWRRVVAAAGLGLTLGGFRNLARSLHDLLGVVERQLDLRQESLALRNASGDLERMSDTQPHRVRVPRCLLAGDGVLVMERLDMVPLVLLQGAALLPPLTEAIRYRDFLMTSEASVLHSDLHLSNLGALREDPRYLVVVDFGATVQGHDLEVVRGVVASIFEGDCETLTTILSKLLEQETTPVLAAHLAELLRDRAVRETLSKSALAEHILEVARQAQLLGVYLPSYLVETIIAVNHFLLLDGLFSIHSHRETETISHASY
jgi:predicted unusual protein kinase regulating ubiquinone biosynthesis (AarF/ABC1/UbiB family)